MNRLLLSVVVLFSACFFAAGAQAGSLVGYVVHGDGEPVAGARVIVPDLNRSAITDINGRYDLGTVDDGSYELVVVSSRHPESAASVSVDDAGARPEFLRMGRELLPKIVVYGSPLGTSALRSTQPTSVLLGEDLERKREPTLGETLNKELGVSSSYFGPGSSRPVIRGLQGNRVRIQEDGITSMDASTSSVDHASTVEPLLAERIEVIRGPGTLAYGPNAIGGIVNVIDGRIPETVPAQAFSGAAELRLNSVADGIEGVARLDGGSNNLAWHVDVYGRDNEDYDIPGEALREHDEDHDDDHGDGDDHGHGDEETSHGVLENSFVESNGGSIGGSYIDDWGFVGASVSRFETQYGIPGAHAHHEDDDHGDGDGHGDGDDHDDGDHDHEEEESVAIDMEQTRFDLKGQLNAPTRGIERVRFRLGANNYEHTELEGDEIGTRFDNDEYEGRIESVHTPLAGWRGAFGLQFGDRDFSAIGEEAFVMPSNTGSWGVFLIEEYDDIENWRFEFGLRYDDVDVSLDNPLLFDPDDPSLASRKFDFLSGSVGAHWQIAEQWSLSGNLARAGRAPSVEELYSNGAHIATQSFEIGDPNLDEERVTSLDIGLGFASGPWFANLNWFLNDFSNFIYQGETDLIEDGFPVRPWLQEGADFDGWEFELGMDTIESNAGLWSWRVFYDTVSGELDRGGNLPRITPSRVGAELSWESGPWHAGVDLFDVASQSDVAVNEEPTDGYTLFNADVGYRLSSGRTTWDLFLRGRNLGDQEARVHTSLLVDQAPLPGRNVILGVRATF